LGIAVEVLSIHRAFFLFGFSAIDGRVSWRLAIHFLFGSRCAGVIQAFAVVTGGCIGSCRLVWRLWIEMAGWE